MPKNQKFETKKIDNSVQILGVTLTSSNADRVLSKIHLQRKNLYHVITLNPEFVVEARGNSRFSNVLSRAHLVVPDGWGIVWAAKLLAGVELGRITGVYLTDEILKYANKHEKKVFVLGARAGVAEKAAENMLKQYPHIRIAVFEGAKTVALEKREEVSMTIAKINAFEPDYLLVAYGSPWQDIWIEDNRPYLRVKVAIGVGGVLDEWAGVVPVCPEWLDRIRLKWFFRLATEPKRWRRQLRLVVFVFFVLREYFGKIYHKLID